MIEIWSLIPTSQVDISHNYVTLFQDLNHAPPSRYPLANDITYVVILKLQSFAICIESIYHN